MGWPKGRKLPEKHRQAISAAKKGIPHEPAHAAAISVARKKQEDEDQEMAQLFHIVFQILEALAIRHRAFG